MILGRQREFLRYFYYKSFSSPTYGLFTFLFLSFRVMPKPSYERVINDEKEKENNSHPLSSASFFSQLTFWWMFKTLKTGNKCPLERADFLPLHEADRTEELTERFRNLWNNTLHKCDEKGKQPKLWKCVLRFISFKEVCVVLWIWMLEATCRILQPWILGILVSLLMQPEYDRRLAYACAGLLALVALVCASAHVASFKCEMLGLRLSSALRGIVYLKVSRSASFKMKKTLVFVITSVRNTKKGGVTRDDLQRLFFAQQVGVASCPV